MRYVVLAFAVAGCAGSGGRMEMQGREASFEARQEFAFTLPDGAARLRAWLTMPQDDPLQTVKDFKIESPYAHRIVKDSEGNRFVYIEIEKPRREFKIVETFTITRREQTSKLDAAKTRTIDDSEREKYAKYLQANENVTINDEIRAIAAQATGGDRNPVSAGRKLYDWTLANIEYWVKYPDKLKASPVGSTTYCLAHKTGNCTDFHSLWASLARASDIPTQIVYGSFFKKDLDGKDADQSYHCWPEFYVPGTGWVPHDVAVADIFVGDFALTKDNEPKVQLTTADGYSGPDKAKVDYYFGNIDERRVTWSRGRDLVLSPKPDASPTVNAVPKAYVEVDTLSRILWLECITTKPYPTRAALSEDIVRVLREELHFLLAGGAAIVQFDEPVLTEVVHTGPSTGRSFMCGALSAKEDQQKELAFARDVFNRVVEGLPRDRVAIHICRGNWSPDERVALSGDYRPLMLLLRSLNVGTYFLELATPRAGEIDVLKGLPEDRRVGVGVVNPKLERVETVDEIVERMRRAIDVFGRDRVLFTPDCGFGTFADNPVTSAKLAEQKLAAMVSATSSFSDRPPD